MTSVGHCILILTPPVMDLSAPPFSVISQLIAVFGGLFPVAGDPKRVEIVLARGPLLLSPPRYRPLLFMAASPTPRTPLVEVYACAWRLSGEHSPPIIQNSLHLLRSVVSMGLQLVTSSVVSQYNTTNKLWSVRGVRREPVTGRIIRGWAVQSWL